MNDSEKTQNEKDIQLNKISSFNEQKQFFQQFQCVIIFILNMVIIILIAILTLKYIYLTKIPQFKDQLLQNKKQPLLFWQKFIRNIHKFQISKLIFEQEKSKIQLKKIATFRLINSIAKQLKQFNVNRQKIKNVLKYLLLQNAPYNHQTKTIADNERQYYERNYNISKYEQKHFCIVVSSYNNMKNYRYVRNLNSLFQQQYDNYHIVYINDASTDDTVEKVKEYQKIYEIPENKLIIVNNSKNMKPAYSINRAIHNYCEKGQILAIIDGDDQLIGRQVFKLYNAVFQNKKALYVYSLQLNEYKNYFQIEHKKPYTAQQLKQGNYRNIFDRKFNHMSASYVNLYLRIKEQDLKNDDGQWFQSATDDANRFPMMQMSCGKIQYIKELIYRYKPSEISMGQINNDQITNVHIIRNRPKYQCVHDIF